MTFEKQLKELYKVTTDLNNKLDKKLINRDEYDKLAKENYSKIKEVRKQLPRFDLKELLGEDWFDKHYISAREMAIDLDSVVYLQIYSAYEDFQGEDTIASLKKFVNDYPNFKVWKGYEGNETFFFSKVPVMLSFETTDPLHRGATATIHNCPKNVLICLDMD